MCGIRTMVGSGSCAVSVVWTVEGGELHLEITKAGSSGSSELLAWKGCLEPLPEGRVCEWTQ